MAPRVSTCFSALALLAPLVVGRLSPPPPVSMSRVMGVAQAEVSDANSSFVDVLRFVESAHGQENEDLAPKADPITIGRLVDDAHREMNDAKKVITVAAQFDRENASSIDHLAAPLEVSMARVMSAAKAELSDANSSLIDSEQLMAQEHALERSHLAFAKKNNGDVPKLMDDAWREMNDASDVIKVAAQFAHDSASDHVLPSQPAKMARDMTAAKAEVSKAKSALGHAKQQPSMAMAGVMSAAEADLADAESSLQEAWGVGGRASAEFKREGKAAKKDEADALKLMSRAFREAHAVELMVT